MESVSSVVHALKVHVYSIVANAMILFLVLIVQIMLFCRIVRLFSYLSLPEAEGRSSMSFVVLLCQIRYIIV